MLDFILLIAQLAQLFIGVSIAISMFEFYDKLKEIKLSINHMARKQERKKPTEEV